MLKDLSEKYYRQNNNCSESIMKAANEYYALGLDEKTFKAFGGFGAGMQCGDVCGGLTSAIGVISTKYIETVAHETTNLRPYVLKLIRNFRATFGSQLCAQIKAKHYSSTNRCLETIKLASDILEDTITQIDKEEI